MDIARRKGERILTKLANLKLLWVTTNSCFPSPTAKKKQVVVNEAEQHEQAVMLT